MPKKRKEGGLESLLDELRAAREQPAAEASIACMKRALGGKESFAVAAAAAIVGENEIEELGSLLAPAFARFVPDGVKTDPGCKAKEAIAVASCRMGLPATDMFLVGVRHVQLEPVWGGRQDTAAALRAQCAVGLAQMDHPAAAVEVAELLADSEWVARSGAARALGVMSSVVSEPLLRYKLKIGDAEPGVIGDCFRSLLAVAPSSIDLVAARLEDRDAAIAEQAALALGESRHPSALPLLKKGYDAAVEGSRRRVFLVAIVMLRSDEAHAFVFDQLAEARPATAMQAVDALAIYQHDPRVRDRVLAIVRKRGDAKLSAHAQEKMRG